MDKSTPLQSSARDVCGVVKPKKIGCQESRRQILFKTVDKTRIRWNKILFIDKTDMSPKSSSDIMYVDQQTHVDHNASVL